MRDLLERLTTEGVLGGGISVAYVYKLLHKILGKDQFGKITKKGKSITIATKVDAGMDGQKQFDKFADEIQKKHPDANVDHKSGGKVWTIHLP